MCGENVTIACFSHYTSWVRIFFNILDGSKFLKFSAFVDPRFISFIRLYSYTRSTMRVRSVS